MAITIDEEIKKPITDVYARAYIKRRNTVNGTYENDWYEITNYVKKFGSIQTAVDDIKLNSFKSSGINMTVINSEGKFNREDDANSLWNGYLTRYRTLVKLKGGYTNVDDTTGTQSITLGADLLVNGACEAIAGWTPAGGYSAFSVSTAFVMQGTYSINLVKNAAAGIAAMYQDIAVTTGQNYRWQVYVRGLRLNHIGILNGTTATTSYTNYTDTSGAVWRYYHDSITAQTSTVQLSISIFTSAPGVSAYAYVDDCKVQQISTVTASGVIDNSSQGIFILADEIPLSGDKNECSLRCKSLNTIFQEVKASDIPSITGTGTASEIVTKIKNATDGSGSFIFRTFIDNDYWHIQTTTLNYILNAGSSLDDMTCWELMTKLAESEGYVVFIDRKGEFHFKSRDPLTTTSAFTFNGLGYRNMSIKSIPEYYEAINKTYNYIRCKFADADTTTSYANYGTTTAINNSNASWKYGQRIYELENIYLNSTTANTVVQTLWNLYNTPKYNVKIKTKLVPHLNVMDKITLNYSSANLVGSALWDIAEFDVDYFPSTIGDNINFEGDYFTIISKTVNLDTYECEFLLEEII